MLHSSDRPDMVNHNAVLRVCEQGKQWQRQHCSDMLDMPSHNAVLRVCEQGKHWQKALRLLQEMPHRSLRPLVVSHCAAVSACY